MIRRGAPPYLECSTKGDKRFSAFCARIKSRGYNSIEEIYQAAKIFPNGDTGLSWRKAKGRKAVNIKELKKLYSELWDVYIEDNPHLLRVLKNITGLSDIFGQEGCQCQVIELWRIRNESSDCRK